jgi:hypothetical protein
MEFAEYTLLIFISENKLFKQILKVMKKKSSFIINIMCLLQYDEQIVSTVQIVRRANCPERIIRRANYPLIELSTERIVRHVNCTVPTVPSKLSTA